jgi:hypothetical protein
MKWAEKSNGLIGVTVISIVQLFWRVKLEGIEGTQRRMLGEFTRQVAVKSNQRMNL